MQLNPGDKKELCCSVVVFNRACLCSERIQNHRQLLTKCSLSTDVASGATDRKHFIADEDRLDKGFVGVAKR